MADEFDAREQRILSRYQSDVQPPATTATGLSTEDRALIDRVTGREAISNAQTTVNLRDAATGSADDFAKRKRVAARLGLPINVVESTWDESQQQDAAKRFDSTAGPVLRGRFIDPEFAKLAHDDTDNLSSIEALFGSLKAGAKYIVSAPDSRKTLGGDIKAGALRASGGAAGAFRAGAETVAPVLDPLERISSIGGNPLRRLAEGFGMIAQDNERAAKAASPDSGNLVADAISSGVQSAVGNILALPLALVPGGQLAALTLMSAQAGGQSYQKAREKGIGQTQSLVYGASDALVEAATEMIPLSRLIGDVKAGSGILKTLLTQASLEVPGEQIATILQDANEWATLNPEKTAAQFLAERPDAAARTLIATIVGVGGNVAVTSAIQSVADRSAGHDRRAQEAESTAAGMDQLAQLAEASKLRQRDPESFQAFADELVRDDVPNLYVDAQALMQSGVDLEALARAVPSVADQIEGAAATGGDLVIPTAELLAAQSDPALKQSLIDNARTAPDAMSRAEAQTFMKEQGETIKAEIEQEISRREQDMTWQAQRDEVAKEFQRQLDEVGRFQPEVNKQYANLLGSFYATQAERAGVTAQELAQKYQLRISDKAPAAGGQSVEQGSQRFTEDNRLSNLAADGSSWQRIRESNPELAKLGPDDDVTIYRATIGDMIRPDDFVAVNKKTLAAELKNVKARDKTAKIISQNVKVRDLLMGNDATEFVYFPQSPQVSSGPKSANILEQDARGQLTFGADITQIPSVMSVFENADWSSVIHESGHFFLEVQADLAARIDAQIREGASVSDGERQILADMNTALDWMGVKDSPEASALTQWLAMPLDEKRSMHEQFARGWEAYAFEGKAPSMELRGVFQRFSAWLKQVYRSLKNLNVTLTDEVRGVFDRMIATEDQIREAEQVRAMGPLFTDAGGMEAEQWAKYQELGKKPTQDATEALQARALKDMKWLDNAKSKKLKELQKEADAIRRDIRMEVQREVMSRPVYRAWQFLTGKDGVGAKGDKTKASASVDPTQDSLFTAIAKHGGLNKSEAVKTWGVDPKEKLSSGVFGKPVLRVDGGLSIDAIIERLAEDGYILPDEDGNIYPQVLEDLFDAERRGSPVYSTRRDYSSMLDSGVDALPDHYTHGKLSTDALRDQYGTKDEALWRVLSDRRMTSPDGVMPDVLAETFGFPSGDAMVRELASARGPKAVIAELTDQRMLERHGDLGTPEGLERATNEALANAARTKFVATELKALEEAASARQVTGIDARGRRTTVDVMDEAAKEYASQTIGRMSVKDVKPDRFEAAATRAAKAAAKAFKAGDLEEAARHKRSELIQTHAAKAAHDAIAEIRKARDFFSDINNRSLEKIGKTRDVDVVQAIRSILAEYGIGTKGEKARQYLEAVERNDPDMHKVLKERIDALVEVAAPVDSISVDSLRMLNDEIGALWYLARRSRQMEVDGDLIDRQEVQDSLLARLKTIGIPERIPGEGMAVTDAERRVARIREALAALRRVENWAVGMDGKDSGDFTRYVFRPIKEAADNYRTDKAKALKQYRELLKGVDVGRSRISAPELGYEFGASRGGSGKAELLHAILHTGNDSNKRKLLLGRSWATQLDDGTIDAGRWDRFIERMIREGTLTKQDFDFAQGVWDLLEGMKPLAQKTHRDVFGRYFDEITANPVTNSLGTWAGGYVPAMTDAEVVKDAKTRDLAEAENSTMAFAFPATAKGFTKSRVEYNKPLLLDLRALSQHIDKVLLFSHMEQHVRDVRRVLASGDVAEPLHRVDPAAFGSLITPWLNRAARQQVETPIPGDGGMMRVLSKLRSRAGMAAMFANVANTAQQVTGLSIAAVKVPPSQLMSATARYLTSPRKTAQSVAEASQYMAGRMDNEVAQMSQDIKEILLNPSLYEKAQNWSAKHAYFMQSAVDNVIGPIVWTGAYNHALEQGMSEDDARRHGDAVVRQTQGSTLPEDISRIESGNAWWRMFAQFAGYFNMQANLLGTEFSNQMRDLGLRKGAGKGLYIFTLGFLVPALISEMIVQAFRGGPGDDDKDGEYLDDWFAALGLGTIRSGIAMVPVAGQVANYGVNLANTKPYDDRISTAPAISMLESAVRAPQSIYAASMDDGNKQKAVRDVATLISITTGLPANAIARPLGYIAGVEDDKISPTGPVDVARGLVTGVASPESK